MTGIAAPASRPNALVEIVVTIVVPSLLLLQPGNLLGTAPTLALALAFPIGWGLWDGWRRRHLSWLSVIGIVSTLLTGGIGLLQLDSGWLAVKEGAISALLGIAVAISAGSQRPLIHALVFDAAVIDRQRVERALAERGTAAAFEARLRSATLWLAATFFYSAAASYLLARHVIHSASGSAAFNAELGRLTLLGWPLVALPTMLMMLALFWWIARVARALTGLTVAEMVAPGAKL